MLDIKNAIVRTVGIVKTLQLDKIKHLEIYQSIENQLKEVIIKFICKQLKVENYELERIEMIENLNQDRLFQASIEKVEIREKFPDFQPNLSVESSPEHRKEVMNTVRSVL